MSISADSEASPHPPVLPLLALVTDYGTDDWFVGVMKGVIKTICPRAEIVDICHNVGPFSVAAGGLILGEAWRYFPEGTIFIGVVDPGVGTGREPVLVRAQERWFLAPNNGLLNFLVTESASSRHYPSASEAPPECRLLSNSAYHLPDASDTFHGRDVFAPAAAHLAAGVPWTQIAPRKTTLYGLPTSAASADSGAIEGNVIHFDHFGNAITNITRDLLRELLQSDASGLTERQLKSDSLHVICGGHSIAGIARTYADVEPGRTVAYWGSSGHLEMAVNRGNARAELELRLLDKVTVLTADSGE